MKGENVCAHFPNVTVWFIYFCTEYFSHFSSVWANTTIENISILKQSPGNNFSWDIFLLLVSLFSQTTFWDVEYEKFHYLTNGEKAFKENLKILHFCYIVWYSISLILASVDCYGILFFSCFKLYSYEKQTNVKFYIFLVSDNYFCGLCFKNFLCYYLRSKNSINTYRKVAKMAK